MKKLIIFLFISFTIYAELDNAYKNLTILPLNLWGWLNVSNLEKIPHLLKQCKAKTVVELGSWLGKFTEHMAKHLKEDGKIYAVDVWVETPECTQAMQKSSEELADFYDNLYNQFLSNMIHVGIHNKVIPIRMTTLQAASFLNINPDLVYVDASHKEEDVYNDIKAWYPKLVSGGIMCGDDWGWPTVRQGVIKIANKLNCQIYSEGNIWWFNPK